jgi:hypothetical protein
MMIQEGSVKGLAWDRLCEAGATSTQAVQARIRAFAHERGLPPEEIHKLMYKRPATGHVIDFCRKHKVNADWLLFGDLRSAGLADNDHPAKAGPAPSLRPG